jgi:UTP-glucose-1-phosphate uridylyltransferase
MASLTLVVMAAGIGSRYGGLKQIDPVGPNGEIVIDYSIYDALRAGFDKVVFIIRREIEDVFRRQVGRTVEGRVETAYVFQELDALPEGFHIPPGRTKPWGTAHAILRAKDEVATPFAAVNADDYYGRTAFGSMAAHMRKAVDTPAFYDYAMVGYILESTLSEHGHVARGVCAADPEGCLVDICERLEVRRCEDGVRYTDNGRDWIDIPADSIVSMNIWGFTPSIFGELEARFPVFLKANEPLISKAEFLIPEVVGSLIREKKARVKVLPTHERWYGVTYPEDRPRVQAAIRKLVANGLYPENLWGS